MTEWTQPLRNGAKIPDHPDGTTARKIIKLGEVVDAKDGHPLTAGLHESDIRSLMSGNHALDHLYRFAIKQIGDDKVIYHTRSRVIIAVETEDADIQ
jgi:hypothetical protein